MLWTWGRHLVQTLFHQLAVAASSQSFQGKMVLHALTCAADSLRPPPRHSLWERVRLNRRRHDEEWRVLLGGPPFSG